MIPTAPQIGFDRFIQLDWVTAALKVRAGVASLDELNELLDAAGLGNEAKIKTRTKLNALVLEPRSDLVDFINRGIELFSGAKPQQDAAGFAWGSALATYPYFGKVAEFTGRLTAMQGDCSMPEVHRRMSELYGERGNIKTATRAVIQTQVDWGAIRRVTKGNRIERLAPKPVTDPMKISWLIEAVLRYHGKAMALATLQSTAALYPFSFDQPLGYVVSKSPALELRAAGPSNQFVALRHTLRNEHEYKNRQYKRASKLVRRGELRGHGRSVAPISVRGDLGERLRGQASRRGAINAARRSDRSQVVLYAQAWAAL